MSPDAPRDNRAHVWHRVKSKGGGGSFVLRCTAGQHVLFAHASRCMHAARCIGRRRGAPAEAAADLLWSCGCMLHPALPGNFLHLARIFV